jgi:hypothetical protein
VKFSKRIRELQKIARRIKPGSVPDALVDVTTGGTFVRPTARRVRGGVGGPARWM